MNRHRFSRIITAWLLSSLMAGLALAQQAPPAHVVVSADGQRAPSPGYAWLNSTDGDLRVRWVPGLAHRTEKNLLAGPTEGAWRPAPGYRWANSTPGDLTVVALGKGPDDAAVGRAIVKILGATLAHAASQPGENDGLGETIFREFAKMGRDELIEGAVRDLFTDLGRNEVAAVRRWICLDLDGRLDERNWRAATAREELAAALRRDDVDAANAFEVADFLSRLHQTRVSQSR